MPPKRRHRNDSESSSGAVKRIKIVAEANQNEKPTVMCEICSQILKSLETLKSHKNKKAMHENEQFIYTDFGYDKVKIASIGYILSCILFLTYVSY